MSSRHSIEIGGRIQFFGLCERHALPMIGRAWVGYIGHEQIVGLSKLTRLARLFARRFTFVWRGNYDNNPALRAEFHPACAPK